MKEWFFKEIKMAKTMPIVTHCQYYIVFAQPMA